MNKFSKILGLLLVCIGFLWACLACVQHTEEVRWLPYGLALAAGVVGVFFMRYLDHQQYRASHTVNQNIDSATQSLTRIVTNMNTFLAQNNAVDTFQVRHWIDEHLRNDLATFVDARQSISHQHGLQAYADVMSSFATGERYLNRIWSASADGYVEEVNAYLPRAHEQFSLSLQQIQQLSKNNFPAINSEP